MPGSAKCFLPGVDELVLDASVWGAAFILSIQISEPLEKWR